MTSSAAVNVPVNEKLKEQDVNNKLQLYGIYSAFANGKVPSVRTVNSCSFTCEHASDSRTCLFGETNNPIRTSKSMSH